MKRGTPNHPKVALFADAIRRRRPEAIGYLELLFHFTAQYAPDGAIGRYDDKRIAAGIDWMGRPSQVIDALVAAGWLDRDPVARLLVHDWADHADRSTLARLARAGKTPAKPNHEVTAEVCTQSVTKRNTRCELDAHLPVPEPEPEPIPEPEPPRGAFAPHAIDDYGSWPDADLPDDWQERIARAAHGWPTPSGIERGKALMREVVMSSADKLATLRILEANIPAQAAYYRRQGGRYAKSLANVMRDGDWMHGAPADPEEEMF